MHILKLIVTCFAVSLPLMGHALTFDDLRPDAPPCKQSKAKRPKLPADRELPYADVLRHDFNGNGWCDYAVAVPYPFNSKMASYSIDESMILGGDKKWRPVLTGKKWINIDEGTYSAIDFPLFQLDLTDIHLVHPKTGGAPYMLGLWASGTGPSWQQNPNPPHCRQYSSVYRWDEAVGTFRRIDEATAKVVVAYYYRFIARPCLTENECRFFAHCRYEDRADSSQHEATSPERR